MIVSSPRFIWFDPVHTPDPLIALPDETSNEADSSPAAIDLSPECQSYLVAEFNRDEVLVLVEELAHIRTEDRKVVRLQVIEDYLAAPVVSLLL